MPKKLEKSINKRLLGAILGGAAVGVGARSTTKQGKRRRQRMGSFLRKGYKQMHTDLASPKKKRK